MTNTELSNYNEFLLTQTLLSQKGIIKLIYRGDSLKNICEKLNVQYQSDKTDVYIVLERLFMVGEKAKRYFTDDTSFEIDNCENIVFDKIIKYINDSIKNRNKNVITFFERNHHVKDFFLNKNNKVEFLSKIKNVSKEERLVIRNYYLTLLHQLASINYRNKSHFVSTSIDYKIAEKFSKSNRNVEKVILHCWNPLQIETSIVKKYKLPTYSLGPYHYQKEYSLLGGIFPHFIFGVEFSHLNKFFPNPNILNQKITTETFYYGLNIDQTNFYDVLNSTNYKKAIISNGFEIWENNTAGKMS